MEDDKIKELFKGFDPKISNNADFMARLRKNLEAVEVVKQYTIELRKRDRIAVVIAAISGFAMGVLLTLLFPLIGEWLSTFNISLPQIGNADITFDFSIVRRLLMAGISAVTALTVYDLAAARLSIPKENQH